MSAETVVADSGQFTVKPHTIHCVYEKMFWPIHAIGR